MDGIDLTRLTASQLRALSQRAGALAEVKSDRRWEWMAEQIGWELLASLPTKSYPHKVEGDYPPIRAEEMRSLGAPAVRGILASGRAFIAVSFKQEGKEGESRQLFFQRYSGGAPMKSVTYKPTSVHIQVHRMPESAHWSNWVCSEDIGGPARIANAYSKEALGELRALLSGDKEGARGRHLSLTAQMGCSQVSRAAGSTGSSS